MIYAFTFVALCCMRWMCEGYIVLEILDLLKNLISESVRD